VCNAVRQPGFFYNNAALTEDLFKQLSRWIVSCHAKDLAFLPEMNVHFVEVIPAAARSTTRPISAPSNATPRASPHARTPRTAEEYLEGATYIRKMAAAAGVPLSA
jgi:hypothetical protein